MTEADTFWPTTRVKLFDPSLYKNDRSTPASVTWRPATVVRWYGYESERYGRYPSLIDVKFDHQNNISKGHFTRGVELL